MHIRCYPHCIISPTPALQDPKLGQHEGLWPVGLSSKHCLLASGRGWSSLESELGSIFRETGDKDIFFQF